MLIGVCAYKGVEDEQFCQKHSQHDLCKIILKKNSMTQLMTQIDPANDKNMCW